MIIIKNLFKKFDNHTVLNVSKLELPREGLICVCGESGCGKTTLLNCIGGLLNYSGSISFDNVKIEDLKDDEKASFRLRNIGFIFQDFKLFEFQKVADNISLPLKTLTNYKENKIRRKTNDLLELVELKNFNERIANTLSGGEKQRIAIARACSNTPKCILADEPTGSLDDKNSENIMSILKALSKRSLVLMVTHDEELANKFSDKIIYMANGEIDHVVESHEKRSVNKLVITENFRTNKKPGLPLGFVFKHVLQNLKCKKIRTFFSFLFMSIGLLGVGLSISFSSSIANDIKKTYSSLVEDSEISLKKRDYVKKDYVSLPIEEGLDIKNRFSDNVIDVGCLYDADFESYFVDQNGAFFVTNGNKYKLEGFSARTINDFYWLDEITSEIYPSNISIMDNDEVVLGLTINEIRIICYSLGIEKSLLALSNYLEYNSIPIVFEFENDSWEYSDEQIFTMIGFTLSSESFIANSNHLWNEEILENRMRFPTKEQYINNEYPWIMNKLTYIKCNNAERLISDLRKLSEYKYLIFDLCDEKYFPFKNSAYYSNNKLVLYYGDSTYFNSVETSLIKTVSKNLKNTIIYNDKGYVNYSENLLNGFANKTYFSLDNDLLFETMENNSSISLQDNETEVLPNNIISSDYSSTFGNSVKFSTNFSGLSEGRFPIDIGEIVVSKGLLYRLYESDLSPDYLYVATVKKEINEDYGIFVREYKISSLKIVGIVNEEKLRIYHDENWTQDFYLLDVGFSGLDLLPNAISFSLKDKDLEEDTIEKFNKAFPYYDIINPLQDINESIDSLCNIMSIFILCIASISLIISFILLFACCYLHLKDSKKDIALIRCIGVTRKDSRKFVYVYSFISTGISLIVSCFELIIASVFIGLISSNSLSVNFDFSLNPFAIIFMLLVASIIAVISSLIFGKQVSKIDAAECLKT